MTAFFITGTDTGCGKTYVTTLLVKYFQQQQINCIALKPIASGCELHESRWINEDIEKLMNVNKLPLVINHWLFQPPISPHFAAFEEGFNITANQVASFCQQPQFMNFDLRLIEGAGGLMVPLNQSETWIDLVKLDQMPLITVVGIRLGCINHSLLMNHVIQSHQLPVAGWIANIIDNHTDLIDENIDDIESRLNMPLLARVDYNAKQLKPTEKMQALLSRI